MTILPEDLARLSPIGHEHVNVYGIYSFQLSEPVQQGSFHPLRELDEGDEGETNGLPENVSEIRFGA